MIVAARPFYACSLQLNMAQRKKAAESIRNEEL